MAHTTDEYRVEPESAKDFDNMGGANVTKPGKKHRVQNCRYAR